jgi:hypothetical protein
MGKKKKAEALRQSGLAMATNFLNYGGQYHHHKDQMIFGGAGLYIAACSYLLFSEDVELFVSTDPVLSMILFGASALGAFKFILAQYKWRKHAADLVRSCTTLSSHWLLTAPSKVDLEPVPWGDRKLPRGLANEMNATANNGKWGDAKWVFGMITLWSFITAIHLFGDLICRWACS